MKNSKASNGVKTFQPMFIIDGLPENAKEWYLKELIEKKIRHREDLQGFSWRVQAIHHCRRGFGKQVKLGKIETWF